MGWTESCYTQRAEFTFYFHSENVAHRWHKSKAQGQIYTIPPLSGEDYKLWFFSLLDLLHGVIISSLLHSNIVLSTQFSKYLKKWETHLIKHVWLEALKGFVCKEVFWKKKPCQYGADIRCVASCLNRHVFTASLDDGEWNRAWKFWDYLDTV